MSQRLHIKKQRCVKIFVRIIGTLGIFLLSLFVSSNQIYAAGSCSQVTVNGQESIKIVADPGYSVQDGDTTLSMICTVGRGSSTIQIDSSSWICDANGKNCWTQVTPEGDSNNCSKYNVTVNITFPGSRPLVVCQTTYNVAVTDDTIQNVQLHCGTLVSDAVSQLPPPYCNINGANTLSAVLCSSNSRKGSPCCENGTYCAQYNSIQNHPVNPVPFDLCAQTGDPAKCKACQDQYTDEDGNPVGLWTAVGCINPTKEGITISAIKLGLGIGGGVVLLMILAASFKLTTSKGDPKATEEAKEMITNAIGGLLFILFSVVLVQTIGKGLLQIPGF